MKIFASLLLFLAMNAARAQTITGKIIDKDSGYPLSEVSVLVVGSSASAMTNPNGFYTILVPYPNAKLVYSLSDYVTQVVSATKNPTLNISLEKQKLVSYTPSTTSQERDAEVKTSTKKPLFVVDGVAKKDGENPLESMDIDEIENITVLKKQPAVAAYGSMGANGVILIKTQKEK